MRKLLISFVLFFLASTLLWSQAKLSTHWEELTAADFRSAIQQSQGTCLLPFGILEKHGPHLPLDVDLVCPGGISEAGRRRRMIRNEPFPR